jgi:spore photoproduct lyase
MQFFAERAIDNEYIRDRFPNLELIDDYQAFRRESMQREKQCVIFAQKRGRWIKPFHCYSNPTYRYFSLDVAEGCQFDCVYCYLQTYLNHGALVLFVNTDSLLTELQQLSAGNNWVSTGLLSDSLLSESYFPTLPIISKRIPNGTILELRSKSSNVEIVANSTIERSQIVLSWSLNPLPIATQYEYRAASLAERLRAASRAIELGYRVGFHLDPIFHFEGWRESYAALMESLEAFPKDRVAFLSIGLFRYMPDLGNVIRHRFPLHPILSEEFFPDVDGKYHYFRPIRKQMYSAFSEWLERWEVPLFWSMEPEEDFTPKTRTH